MLGRARPGFKKSNSYVCILYNHKSCNRSAIILVHHPALGTTFSAPLSNLDRSISHFIHSISLLYLLASLPPPPSACAYSENHRCPALSSPFARFNYVAIFLHVCNVRVYVHTHVGTYNVRIIALPDHREISARTTLPYSKCVHTCVRNM